MVQHLHESLPQRFIVNLIHVNDPLFLLWTVGLNHFSPVKRAFKRKRVHNVVLSKKHYSACVFFAAFDAEAGVCDAEEAVFVAAHERYYPQLGIL